jgi:hypothetical protein
MLNFLAREAQIMCQWSVIIERENPNETRHQIPNQHPFQMA